MKILESVFLCFLTFYSGKMRISGYDKTKSLGRTNDDVSTEFIRLNYELAIFSP